MRILLLQDQVYLPTFGGGNKANRFLLEALAADGHECEALAAAFTTRAGPANREQLYEQMARRAVPVVETQRGVFTFDYHSVHVTAMEHTTGHKARDQVRRTIVAFQPDWIVVSDDKRRTLLDCAVQADAARVIMILQTVSHLPFGPHATRRSTRQATLMAAARARIVISEYLRSYIETHAHLTTHLLRLPVFGEGPFPIRGAFAKGFVTMINPCVEKGVDIFLALAARHSSVQFAAVPTWGADESTLRLLAAAPNVTIRPPVDDIDEVLVETSVLLVPSIWPEAFGYVVVEAMLRGIPVIASDSGGLPEAKLGVEYVVPVRPAERRRGAYVSPEQNMAPWSMALQTLLADEEAYHECSRASRRAALAYVERARAEDFERLVRSLDRGAETVTPREC